MDNPLSSDWLDTIVERVPDERDQVLIRESVAAARTSAFRLAVVGAWLAVAESLKRRFQELAQSDTEAGRITKEVGEREKKQRSVDGFLVGKAHEYGLTSVVEDHALRALFEARNIFGHPYAEQPTEDDVRSAIASAVEHLLSKPLLLGHRFADEEIERITDRAGWLGDSWIAVRKRVDFALGRIDPAIRGYLFVGIIRSSESRFHDVDFLASPFARRVQWYLERMLEVDGTSLWNSLADEEIVDQYPGIGSLVLSYRGVFQGLGDVARDSVVGELCENAIASQAHLDRILEIQEESGFSDPEGVRVGNVLKGLDVKGLVARGVPLEMFAQRVIDELASHNWPRQNAGARAVASAGGEQVANIEPAVQEQLGRNVLQSADGTARVSMELLESLKADASHWPNAFVYGLVAECLVNDKGWFRVKERCLHSAVAALGTLPEDRRSKVVDQLVKLVEGASLWIDEDAGWVAEPFEEVLGTGSGRLASVIRRTS